MMIAFRGTLWLRAAAARQWAVLGALETHLNGRGHDGLDPWRIFLFFLIGGIACCLSHGCVCPVDVVKTRQQGSGERYVDEATGERKGMLRTALQMNEEEGPGVFFTGFGATVYGYFVQGAFKYGLWAVFKFCFGFYTYEEGSLNRFFALVCAAFFAELIASTFLCPYERARIRCVAQPDFAPTVASAVGKLQDEQGVIGGLFGPGGSALGPTLLKMCSYTTVQLTIFQLLTDAAFDRRGSEDYPRIAIVLPCAITAAIVAVVASQPGDALQTRASKAAKGGEAIPSMAESAQALGWAGTWVGLSTRMVMFGSMVVIQLMVYDSLRQVFGLEPHGANEENL